MNTLLIYMIKVAVYMAGFYTVYYMFLSRDTLYRRNRLVLLFSVILSMVMPFVTVSTRGSGGIFYFGKVLSEVFVTADSSQLAGNSVRAERAVFITVLYRVYIGGLLLFGIKLLIDFINLVFLIARRKDRENHIVRFEGFNTAGFSAMGYIFINGSLSDDDAREIIRHEQNHLDNNHFFDILFVEIVKAFQWFNPVIYMLNRSLRAIHEYQADEGCLKSGMTVVHYQNLILNHLFRSKIFVPSNSFSNPSLIKKRMMMMTRVRTGNIASIKLVLLIPVAIPLLLIISSFETNIEKLRDNNGSALNQTEPKRPAVTAEIYKSEVMDQEELLPPPPPPPPLNSNNAVSVSPENSQKVIINDNRALIVDEKKADAPKEVFVVVEEMPRFPGGDAELMKFIYANIEYPEKAKNENIQGRVILRFAVMADGSVDQVMVLKGVDMSLDAEAVRVIKLLPKWSPGKQGGKPVNVWYSVPVTFQLK